MTEVNIWRFSPQQQDALKLLKSIKSTHQPQAAATRLTLAQRGLPTDTILVIGRANGTVELWTWSSRLPEYEAMANIERQEVLLGHTRMVSDLAFSPDGRFLASSSYDGSVQVWDLSNQNHLRQGALRLPASQGLVMALCFVPYPGASSQEYVLISGDSDGHLGAWPLDPSFWFEQVTDSITELSPGQQAFTQAELTRYLGEKQDIETSGLLEITELCQKYRGFFDDEDPCQKEENKQ